jgi:hypothetical protein
MRKLSEIKNQVEFHETHFLKFNESNRYLENIIA